MIESKNLAIYARLLQLDACMIAVAFADALGAEHPHTVRMQTIVQILAEITCDLGTMAELDRRLQAANRCQATEALSETLRALSETLALDRYDLGALPLPHYGENVGSLEDA